jgi:hypothetical protein
MYLGFEHQALLIREQMALSALHLLAAVVSTLLSSYTGVLLTDWLSTMPALG